METSIMRPRHALYLLPFAACLLALPAVAHDIGEPHHHGVQILPLLMRWAHILSAVFLMGGAFFMRFVLTPVANVVLEDPVHDIMRRSIQARWKKFVYVFVTLFLVSGFYNYLFVTRFDHQGEPVYHMLFGIKFLLALVVFTLAMLLIGKTGTAKRVQANSALWTGVLLLFALAVVAIGGYMKLM